MMRRFEALKSIFSLFFLLLFAVSLSVSYTSVESRNRTQVEEYLGLELPQDAQVIHYKRVYKSSEFKIPFYFYIQIEMSEESYNDIAEQLGLELHQATEGPVLFLNGRMAQDKYSPEWWRPPRKDHENLGADGQFIPAQYEGWIVSVFENGVVYIKTFEFGGP